MRNAFLYVVIIISLIISSCTEDEPSFQGKISGFIIYSETGVQKAVYYFAYDNDGRLSERSTPLGQESIIYDGQEISQWIRDQGSGTKTENFEYTNGNVVKVKIDYEFPLSGIDLVEYLYEANKCIQKTELLNNEIVNTYHFIYASNGFIDKIHLERKVQGDTLVYVYEYDNSGNVSDIFLDGNSYSSFEYTTIDNPNYEVSKARLLKIPVDPHSQEKESITAKFMLSHAIYYSSIGTIDQEISYTYTFNDKGKPGIANRNVNGTDEEIIYTYY